VVFGEWYREFNDQEKKLINESGIDVDFYNPNEAKEMRC
jgi:hypothetical protein